MIEQIEVAPIGEAPVLIAGWPGMGQVGSAAASYLRRKLDGQLVARFDVSDYHLADSVEVTDGIGRLSSPPDQFLYRAAEPPVFVFEGSAQLGGHAALRLAVEIADFARDHGVKTVYTGAAWAVPQSFRQPVQVFGVATSEAYRVRFPLLGVEPLKEGRITGLNGLLLGIARQRGLAAACFLATMPQYAIDTTNPRAAKALVRVFERILNTSVDMTELNAAIAETDGLLEQFENRVADAIRSLKQNLEPRGDDDGERPREEAEGDDRPEPQELMERVEQLFEAARSDRAKAILLKQELDRWGLYSLYEDRFLDLFDQTRTGTKD
jgi:predicted ATP-grasp superfamily ATP-dependent carboligase